MNNITIENQNGTLVVDSRLVALDLGISHEAFIKNIRKHQTTVECHFGVFRFQIGKPGELGGRPEKFAYLTEDQATFLMTLSRNTPQVVECKAMLVKQFSNAKKLLSSGSLTPEKALISPAMVAAKEVEEINKIVHFNPRIAQLLIDSAVNYHIENSNAIAPSEPQLRGVVEIAQDMGYKVSMASRTKLGKYVKAVVPDLAQREQRLCNGMMRDINCYPDCDLVRNLIDRFFVEQPN